MTNGIKEANFCLFIITPAAVTAIESNSGPLAFEIQLATAKKNAGKNAFRIIPIFREGDKTSCYLLDHKYLDFRKDSEYQNNFQELLDTLSGTRKKPPLKDMATVNAINLANNQNFKVRRQAIITLKGLNDPNTKEFLEEKILKDSAWQVRRSSIITLSKICPSQMLQILIKALESDPAWQVRKSVAIYLGKLKDVRATESLTKALNDDVWQVREAASSALAKMP